MGVAGREGKSATSIERSTIPGVGDTAERTPKRRTFIDESEVGHGQAVMRTATIVTLRSAFLFMRRDS